MNTLGFWIIEEANKRKYLKLAENVHVYPIDFEGNRLEDRFEPIRFSVDNIKYDYFPHPKAFNYVDACGPATLSLTKNTMI